MVVALQPFVTLRAQETALNINSSSVLQYVTTCRCCGLTQPANTDQHGTTAPVCKHCTWHQGDRPDKRLARAESHESMLRERLERCRASEIRAQRELAQVSADAKERVSSALASRGYLATRLVDAANRCGPRCQAQDLANDRNVVQWARRNRESEW